jgi:anti-anti-sigma factor
VPLEITVTAGELGMVMVLTGETDLATTPELCRELTALLATGAQHMTVDVSALTFADSTSIQALMLAGLTLQRRGGALALLSPQPAVTRLLYLMDADQTLKIRLGAGAGTEPEAI